VVHVAPNTSSSRLIERREEAAVGWTAKSFLAEGLISSSLTTSVTFGIVLARSMAVWAWSSLATRPIR